MCSKKNVLIVDDESGILGMLSAYFSKWGHRVDCTLDGAIAENFSIACKYDLVLTDINMPVCDGVEYLTKLKRANGNKFPCKVIVMTGGASDELLDQVKNLAVDAFIHKPIHFGDLRKMVEHLLA